MSYIAAQRPRKEQLLWQLVDRLLVLKTAEVHPSTTRDFEIDDELKRINHARATTEEEADAFLKSIEL